MVKTMVKNINKESPNREVLPAVIELIAYPQGTQAVSSGRRCLPDFDCSSATIRNVMNDLEDPVGYLTHPLTLKRRRVPTDKGYRWIMWICWPSQIELVEEEKIRITRGQYQRQLNKLRGYPGEDPPSAFLIYPLSAGDRNLSGPGEQDLC